MRNLLPTALLALTLICAPTSPLAWATARADEPSNSHVQMSCAAPFDIGYRLIPFKDSRKAALWYPTSSPPSSFAYSKDIATNLAHNGAPLTACGRFPLVVFAHGMLGCGAQSIFFTEELARRGYVVVAP